MKTLSHSPRTCRSYERVTWHATRGMTPDPMGSTEYSVSAARPWANRITVLVFDIPPATPFNSVCRAIEKAGMEFFKDARRVPFSSLPSAY